MKQERYEPELPIEAYVVSIWKEMVEEEKPTGEILKVSTIQPNGRNYQGRYCFEVFRLQNTE